MFRLFFSIVLAPILFVQILLVILRLHENIRWQWSLVLIPLWTGLFLWFVVLVYRVWGHRMQRRTGVRIGVWHAADSIHHLIWIASLTAVFVLSVIRLDHATTTTLSWSVVFVPLYVLFVFLVLWESWNHWRHHVAWLAGNTQHGSPIIRVLTWIILGAQFLWLGVQLDKEENARAHWALVFLPLWTVFALWLLVLLAISRRKLEGKFSEKPKATLSDLIIYTLIWMSMVTFFILLTVELQAMGNVISSLALFSPLLLLFILFFVGNYFFYWRWHRTKKNDYYAWKTENYIRQTTSVQNHRVDSPGVDENIPTPTSRETTL